MRPFEAGVLAGRRRAVLPHEFVLDALVTLAPITRPMFGCLAVYVEEKIVLILRDRASAPEDNGVWLATTAEHHDSLRREFPAMRSIRLLRRATADLGSTRAFLLGDLAAGILEHAPFEAREGWGGHGRDCKPVTGLTSKASGGELDGAAGRPQRRDISAQRYSTSQLVGLDRAKGG